jgi:hypothetical protein
VSEAHHTPGPWKVVYRDDCDNPPSLLDADGDHVPLSSRDSPVAQANSRLIAAAPDMAEALKDILTDFASFVEDEPDPSIKKLNRARLLKACAALSKAGVE